MAVGAEMSYASTRMSVARNTSVPASVTAVPVVLVEPVLVNPVVTFPRRAGAAGLAMEKMAFRVQPYTSSAKIR